jgi:hypothetical protein
MSSEQETVSTISRKIAILLLFGKITKAHRQIKEMDSNRRWTSEGVFSKKSNAGMTGKSRSAIQALQLISLHASHPREIILTIRACCVAIGFYYNWLIRYPL